MASIGTFPNLPLRQALSHECRGGNMASIQTFLIISTCFLYLVAAGLFSRAVWKFEENIVSLSLSSK